jgi:molybdate transport system ATP-binding protein
MVDPEEAMKLELRQIRLPLTDFVLEVDLEIESRVLGLCGPSGAGKTSLLDLIAGLRRANSARIAVDERILSDSATDRHVAVRERRIGYVPQDLALFPHLSVRRNLGYGRRQDEPAGSLFGLEHVVEVLDIGPLIERDVTELSGGERQRVALGRALLSSPQLLLLDEPLANLDAQLKERILEYLKRVQDEFPVPMIYVSHSDEEVRALCDAVVRIERGKVASAGPL